MAYFGVVLGVFSIMQAPSGITTRPRTTRPRTATTTDND